MPEILYAPNQEKIVTSNAWAFLHWLRTTRGIDLPDWGALQRWWANDQAAFKFRRIEQNGQRSAAVTVADMGANRNSGHPRMVLRGGELVFAWTGTDDSLRVQTATARIQ